MSANPSKQRSTLSESDLTPEQNKAIDRLHDYDETLLIARVGFGKAIVALTAADLLLRYKHLRRVLVLAPLRVAELTWGPEPGKWDHIQSEVAVATGNAGQRTAAVKSGAPIVVTNFENIKWMLTNFAGSFDGLVIDEITKLKSVSGAGAKALRSWVKGLTWRVGMTGTPVAEAGEDIYTQALLLDLGKSLGTRKVSFRQQYFLQADYQGYRWELQPGAAERLSIALQHLLYLADDHSYWDALPPVVDHVVPVAMHEYPRELYEEMKRHSVCETWSGLRVTAVNRAVQTGKLHQIANGGLYDDDGHLVLEDAGHKINALTRLLRDEIRGPAVYVYQFAFELAWLKLLFPGCPVLGESNRVGADEIAAWNRGEYPALIMHPRSAAHGLNLQYGSSTIVHLSPVWGADPWQQCLGRIRRRGTPAGHIDRYILVSEGTMELDMLERMGEKGQAESDLMAAFAK